MQKQTFLFNLNIHIIVGSPKSYWVSLADDCEYRLCVVNRVKRYSYNQPVGTDVCQ